MADFTVPAGLDVRVIVAMDEERGIGKNNDVPWHIPKDWARLKELTMGHSLIMGRKTWDGIGKPLPGRTNIVVTRQSDFKAEGAIVVHSVEDGLTEAVKHDPVAYIFGGEHIFKDGLKYVDKIELTEVSGTHGADTFFPEFEHNFHEVSSEALDEGSHHIRFVDYERNA
ncbi:dihydrofolate reductase [Patescibacteria group bacterium]|nr:dihydrofolate reductase [Patescibacteria group bacterium]